MLRRMFTGLVQAFGRVTSSTPRPAGLRLEVDAAQWSHRPAVGDSVSVSGCCLTVAAPTEGGRLCFDVVAETLRVTTLGALRPGDRVNLEHALRADALLGGHFVQGHVDGVGEVVEVRADPADWRVRVRPADRALMECITRKGSIAVDGVSLTVAGVHGDSFSVALIPTTLEMTTLGALREGSRCNLETDMLAKTVVEFLRRREQGGA